MVGYFFYVVIVIESDRFETEHGFEKINLGDIFFN